MLRVPVRDGKLEVSLVGDGDPVLVIPTAVNPYELAPLAHLLAGTGRFHVVRDLPSLLGWDFTPEHARTIRCLASHP